MNYLENKHVVALLTIPFFMILIAVLFFLNIPGVFEPPYLLLCLNTVFLGLIPLYIAYISLNTFRISRMPGILFLGAGMLVMGAGAIISGWAIGFPDGPNISVTIYNTSALAFAAFSLTAGMAYLNARLAGGRMISAGSGLFLYGIAITGIIIFTAAAFAGIVPPFFVQGSGPTLLRQAILIGSIWLFAIASIHFFVPGSKSRDDFFIFYAIALALIAVGLIGVLMQHAVGSPIGWAGRIAQYAGACSALAAILSVRKTAHLQGARIEEILSRFFGSTDEGWRMLVTGNPDAIVVVQENRFLFANDAALRMYGVASLDQLNRTSVLDHVDPLDRGRVETKFEQVSREPVFLSGEFRIRKSDGTTITVSGRAAPIQFGGKPAILSTLRDITERRQAEEALRWSEEKLKAAFASMAEAVFIADASGRLVEFNDEFVRYHRFRDRDHCSRMIDECPTYLEVWHADGTPAPLEQWAMPRALRGETGSNVEYRLRHRETGETWWGSYNFAPIRDPEGRITGAVVMGREITERKLADEALHLERERLLALINNLPDDVFFVDGDGNVTLINQAARSSLGLAHTDELWRLPEGESMFEVYTPDGHRRGPDESPFIGAFKGDSVRGEELVRNRKTGELRHREYRVAPVLLDGKVVGAVSTVRDITERKRAEEALREREERLQSLYSAMSEGLAVHEIVYDAAGTAIDYRITEANPAFSAHTGISREAAIGSQASVLYGTGSAPYLDIYARVAETGASEEFETTFDPMAKSFHISVFSPGKGKFATVFTDITDRKRAEAALAKVTRRLQTIADNAPIAIYVKDRDGRFVFGNRRLEHYTGLPLESLLGKTDYDFNEKEVADRWRENDLKVMKGQVTKFEETGTDRDGRPYVNISVKFGLPDESGTIAELCGISTDITERKQMEQALQESEEKFRGIVETAEEGIALHDPDGTIAYVNQRMADMLGYPSVEIVGRSSLDFIDGEEMESVSQASGNAQKHGSSSTELRLRKKDGSILWTLVNLSPRQDSAGNFLGYLAMHTDITERKEADEALRWSVQQERERAGELDAILTATPTPIFITHDTAGQHITGNPAADRLLRIPHGGEISLTAPEERRPHNYKCVKDGHELAGDDLPAQRAALGLPVDDYDFDIVFDDGIVRHVIGNGKPLLDEQGKSRGSILAVLDITARKEAEEALQLRQAEIRVLFDNIPAALVLFEATPPYTVIVHNRSYQELFNEPFRSNGMAGLNVYEYAPDVEAAGVVAVFDEVTVAQRPKQFLDFQYRSDPPNERWFNWYIAPIVIDGKTVSLVSMSLDVTAWHRAREEVRKARDELTGKNLDLESLNLELTAIGENLRKSNVELAKNDQELRDALAEREVLLSEIHHRVKNNLSAFISLLSLEGSYDNTPAGIAMKNDLQNRARSMALIHETLYRTHKYSAVDMDVYLGTLVEQIAGTLRTPRSVATTVEAKGMTIDLARATPAGLIVNELVTNALKHAFPEGALTSDGKSPEIAVAMAREDGDCFLRVRDNGIGLPAGFDIATTKTLGLKLVNFLARYQMRAEIDVVTGKGTTFVFRFRDEMNGRKPRADWPED